MIENVTTCSRKSTFQLQGTGIYHTSGKTLFAIGKLSMALFTFSDGDAVQMGNTV